METSCLIPVTLASGVTVSVGVDDGISPLAEEIDDYDVSEFGEDFLDVVRRRGKGECRNVVRNYDYGILTGRECDVRLRALLCLPGRV